jgi:hypothetical protein
MLDAPRSRKDPEHELGDEPEGVVVCAACEAEVARVDDRVTIGAGDLHTFVNPQGQVFELVCFERAAGAVACGRASREFSWFPGHAWRFALCRACGRQLGWHFEGPAVFWGLDRKALRWP